ncbi:MAG: EAL domain-containing protein [Nitrospirae bacterium]|nr:EAL domain-containing protein [Candidatus Manganitrophaceae bacterium]
MKIRTKITLTFLVLSLVPLTMVSYVAYQNGKQALKENLGTTYQLLAQQTIDKIDRRLFEVYRNVGAWSELELMDEVIAGDVDGKMTTFLSSLSQQYGYFSSINAMNKEGVVVASSRPEFIGLDFKKNPFFKIAVAKKSHSEDLYFDSMGQEWVLSFSFPITAKFQQNKVIGVLNARWKAEELVQLAQGLPHEGEGDFHAQVVLVQDEGLVISGPSSRQAGLFENLRINDTLRKAILGVSGGNGYLIGPDVENKEALIGYARSKGYRDFPGMDWRILVLKDVQTAFRSIDRLQWVVFSVAGIVALIVFTLSFWVTRRMTEPILQISEAASRIAKGDFEARAEYQAKDEIGSLTQIFNQMTRDLKEQRAQLVDKHYVDSIIANMMNSLIVIDPEGRIRRVNKSTVALLAYTEEELFEKSIDDIFGEKHPETGAWIADLLQQGFLRNTETTYRNKGGRVIPVWFSCSVMRDTQDRVEGIVCVAQDITERKRSLARLNHMANHDTLTNLPNRTLFLDRLTQLLSGAHRRKRIVAILSLDLDRFKNINDTLGHVIGDLLLKGVSERLMGCVREGDTIARLGGDEFVFILDDITRLEDIGKISKKILEKFKRPFLLKGKELFITTSIGISLYPNDGAIAETLLKNADTAMYRAKEQGKNNYQLFAADMNVKAEEYLKLETHLRYALERDELALHYQPMVDCKTGEVVSMEVLLRWVHSELGEIPPSKFIPIAEETGLIGQIGHWVLKMACAQNKAWQDAGFDTFRVAVNLSARQFDDKKLAKRVQSVLGETGLEPSYLELELTEGIVMKNPAVTVDILRSFHVLGIEISIDDFGTGYSSLSYLKRFPVNSLKIDRSFIQDIPNDLEDAAIIRAVIAMGHSLNLKIIAEGVENVAQLEFLRAMQCDTIQGYLFSTPLPAEIITEKLAQGGGFYVPEDASESFPGYA